MGKLSAKELRRLIVEGEPDEAVSQVQARLEGAGPDERRMVAERLGDVVQLSFDDFAFTNVNQFMAFTRQRIGFDVAEATQWSIDGHGGSLPHGTIWQAIKAVDQLSRAVAASLMVAKRIGVMAASASR